MYMTAVWITLGVLLTFFLLHLFLMLTRRKRATAALLITTPYAHRGLHGADVPENSLAAFRAAVEAGVGIELDVQLSADGEVMVFHDESLLRMTGKDGSLYAHTCEELSLLRLAGTDEHIPTLREVLALVAGRVPLLVEIKPEHAVTSLCAKTAALLDAYDGAYMIESFHPLAVRWFCKNRPAVVRGQLSAHLFVRGKRTASLFLVENLLLNFLARPDFIAFDYHHKNRYSFALCRFIYRPYTLAWTVTDEDGLRASRNFDGIIYEKLSVTALSLAGRYTPNEGEKDDL